MKIKKLKLINFRNFLKREIDFNSTNIFIGDNGKGKTNILESIYFLSTTKSFRTKNNRQLVNWEKDFCRVVGTGENNGNGELTIEVVVNNNPKLGFIKKGKINGVPKKMLDVLGTFKVVLFSPEFIEIVSGSPSLRRRYLDSVLSITDHKYAWSLYQYTQVLRQRNKILGAISLGRAQEDELLFWDKELITYGSYIILRRHNLINFYNKRLAKVYQEISGDSQNQLRLKYLNSMSREEEVIAEEKLRKDFQKVVSDKRQQEIRAEATLVGPQRDEMIFVLNDRSAATFGSRGEFRSIVLALKIVETQYVKVRAKGAKPILLLDDVFSELDEGRRHQLASAISGLQTIITTTDLSHIEPTLAKTATIIKL